MPQKLFRWQPKRHTVSVFHVGLPFGKFAAFFFHFELPLSSKQSELEGDISNAAYRSQR